MIASIITYIMLNYRSNVQFALGAMVCYPILLFFLVGNFRISLIYCDWNWVQVVIYKLVKIIGATYFLIYGGYIIIQDDTPDVELFLLYVFTTSGFWAEMCFAVNSMD